VACASGGDWSLASDFPAQPAFQQSEPCAA